MPRSTFAGHPLHPQLVVAPAGLMPFSLALDVAHAITGKKSFAQAAYYGLVGTAVTAVAAGAAGAMDYFAIPGRSPAKRLANIHASLNLGLVGMTLGNLVVRSRRETPSGALPMLMSVVANAGLLVSAWYGGHLVYEHGLRVKGVDPTAGEDELRLPGDESLAETLASAEGAAPDGERWDSE